jgi:uncharacterized membrane protein
LNAADKTPEQMVIALGWLGIFFAIYMTLPLLNGLVKKIKAQKEEDVLLVLSNAAITFYYLWTMLYTRYRIELSFCAIGLCMAHLIMMIIVNKRCKEDVNSRLALLAIGLFFLTIAIPLYLKMYAVAMAWAVEAVVLAAIGLRYKSISTQICADIAFVLSLAQLADQMPMHSAAFRLILNPAFGTWLFVSICALVCHILYRANKWMADYYGDFISQIIYSVACFLLMFTLAMEWYWHCEYNIIDKLLGETTFINGIILLFTGFISILAARPICPAGKICKVAATVAAFAGSIFTICGLTESYYNSFTIFANINFAYSILFVAGLLTAVWFFRRDVQSDRDSIVFSYIFAITAIFVLWVLLSEEIYLYWYCRDLYLERIANWGFLANMYMSVMWAIYGALLMVTGFWRKAAYLRYISLGLFALLLLKVFVLDMSTVKSVYRIAAFLATGITLVGISYLYQFLKKKGFFDTILIEEKLKD